MESWHSKFGWNDVTELKFFWAAIVVLITSDDVKSFPFPLYFVVKVIFSKLMWEVIYYKGILVKRFQGIQVVD